MNNTIAWQDKLKPARFMDSHYLELNTGPMPIDLRYLEEFMLSTQSSGLPFPVKALFSLRHVLGRLFGWDDAQDDSRPESSSYYWRMTELERHQCFIEPGQRSGPARRLWNDETSAVFEVNNATCQAFAVVALQGKLASLSVFVIETKWWSKYYLALIEPFRKYLVYPLSARWLNSKWKLAHQERAKV